MKSQAVAEKFDQFSWESMRKKDCFEGPPHLINLDSESVALFPSEHGSLADHWAAAGKRVATLSVTVDFCKKQEVYLPRLLPEGKIVSRRRSAFIKEQKKIPGNTPMHRFPELGKMSVWIELKPVYEKLIQMDYLKKGVPEGQVAREVVFVSVTRLKSLATRHRTPKKDLEEETFMAFRCRNVIYIVQKRSVPHHYQKGIAFEEMVTSGREGGSNFSIFRGPLGKHKLFVYGEVDAEDSVGNIIELKDSEPALFGKDKRVITWFQSHVMGIEKIHFGKWDPKVRDEEGKSDSLLGLDSYLVSDLKPKEKADLCYASVGAVLDYLGQLEHGEMMFFHLPQGQKRVEFHKVKQDWLDKDVLLRRPSISQDLYFHELEAEK